MNTGSKCKIEKIERKTYNATYAKIQPLACQPDPRQTNPPELQAIAADETEIKDRFYTDLSFGTGGLRGIIGAGTNRLNIYTVRKATQGLANYILSLGEEEPLKVVIAYDCRRMSRQFCEEAALVLNANGIKSYVFDNLRPTPLLSFAVRYLGCVAGIVITASHNPPEYNGYKVYWDDGGQIPPQRAEAIISEIDKIKDFSDVKTISKADAEKAGLFRIAETKVDDAYKQAVLSQRLNPKPDKSKLEIVFSPLHGTGNIPVRQLLAAAGFKNVYVVKEQSEPDGSFSTVAYPNPEEPEALAMAIKLAAEKSADILLCTDPDADRLGVAVKEAEGKYKILTGNMIGALLTEYILSQKSAAGTLPDNAAIVSTIVSTDLGKAICNAYGVAYHEVLTGFKFIGEKIKKFEETETNTFIFGYEESYGYLAGTHVRDKDAVATAMLVCEAAAFYKQHNMTLWDVMVSLYKKYGYYKESLASVTLKGAEGLANIRLIMDMLRSTPPLSIGDIAVVERRDYKTGQIINCVTGESTSTALPGSDVLYYVLEDDSWLCIRPSGTEPKIKLYFGTVIKAWDNAAKSDLESKAKLAAMEQSLKYICKINNDNDR